MNCRICNKAILQSSARWGIKCKECIKEWRRNWARKRRLLGLPSGGKASKKWWDKYNKEYYSNPVNKKRRSELMKKYRNDPKLRMKHEARWQVARAIKSGLLQRKPCIKCGEIKSEAHHKNYYKPLEVVWLCKEHHRAEHAKAEGKQ